MVHSPMPRKTVQPSASPTPRTVPGRLEQCRGMPSGISGAHMEAMKVGIQDHVEQITCMPLIHTVLEAVWTGEIQQLDLTPPV
jgi:hypothetical protein